MSHTTPRLLRKVKTNQYGLHSSSFILSRCCVLILLNPRGGEKFDKRNVVLELESLKAWVAKGGGKFDKRNVVR